MERSRVAVVDGGGGVDHEYTRGCT
jgi:hypothetical protein